MLDDGARVEPKAIMTPPLDLENLITVSTPVFSSCLQSGETRRKEKKRIETGEGNGETRKKIESGSYGKGRAKFEFP